MENWKDIKGYEGLYQVSSYGRVKGRTREVCRGKQKMMVKGQLLKQYEIKKLRMLAVQLYRKSKRRHYYVHRLVASAFIDNPRKKRTVNHKDGNRLNNYVGNLEWATYSENAYHSYKKLGREGAWKGVYGEDHPRYKSKLHK